MIGDRYKILNAKGRLVGIGFGDELLQPGERIEHFDSEEELLSDADVIKQLHVDEARVAVSVNKSADRTQAFTTKSAVCRAFLNDVPDTGQVGKAVLDLIDTDRYYELYDEYSNTWQMLGDMSPWDLARTIVKKSIAASNAETARRIAILESEKIIKEHDNA